MRFLFILWFLQGLLLVQSLNQAEAATSAEVYATVLRLGDINKKSCNAMLAGRYGSFPQIHQTLKELTADLSNTWGTQEYHEILKIALAEDEPLAVRIAAFDLFKKVPPSRPQVAQTLSEKWSSRLLEAAQEAITGFLTELKINRIGPRTDPETGKFSSGIAALGFTLVALEMRYINRITDVLAKLCGNQPSITSNLETWYFELNKTWPPETDSSLLDEAKTVEEGIIDAVLETRSQAAISVVERIIRYVSSHSEVAFFSDWLASLLYQADESKFNLAPLTSVLEQTFTIMRQQIRQQIDSEQDSKMSQMELGRYYGMRRSLSGLLKRILKLNPTSAETIFFRFFSDTQAALTIPLGPKEWVDLGILASAIGRQPGDPFGSDPGVKQRSDLINVALSGLEKMISDAEKIPYEDDKHGSEILEGKSRNLHVEIEGLLAIFDQWPSEDLPKDLIRLCQHIQTERKHSPLARSFAARLIRRYKQVGR